MKLVIVAALALVAAVAAAPANEKEVKIVRSEFDQQPNGAYVYGFETDDGTNRQEQGEIKQAVDEENKPHDVVVVRGTYSFLDSEGKIHSITYFADETGFHAEGEDVPKAARR